MEEYLKIPLAIVGAATLIVFVFFGMVHAGTGFVTPDKVFTACSSSGYWQYEQKRIECKLVK